MNRTPLLLSLCLVCLPLREAKSEPAIAIPSAETILSTLKPNHPRLLVSSNDFSRLRTDVQANTILGGWNRRIQSRAEALLGEPASRYEIPDGLRLLATSRRVLRRVYDLAFTYRLTADKRFADRAWTELEAAGNFKDWNPRHFLNTAEMTHAFAIGYDWLYDFWTPEQRAFLEKTIIEKGLKPALDCYANKPHWWPGLEHNWNQVCNGGISMGALAIADREPGLAGAFLHKALGSIQLPMRHFAPDGAWAEGPGYWNYATSYNVVFLAGLDSALGTDFGLSNLPGFDQTGFYPVYLSSPAGRAFNFADGGDRIPVGPQLLWLARRFNEPRFADFVKKQEDPSPLDLLWFDPQARSSKGSPLPLDKYFRGVEVATFRSDWENKEAAFLGFKAGKNAVNHSHLDLGSFVFDASGTRWAVDLGSDNYNLPGYFSGKRWTYYRLRAEGHNTLVLNPGAGADQDPAADASIIRFESTPARAFAIADLSSAYGKNAQKVMRGIALLNRKNILVQDEVQAEKPADLWWFMHTPATIQILDSGTSAKLTQGKKTLTARILSPAGATFSILKPEPLPSSPHPEGQAVNKGISKLAIHVKETKDARLAVLLTPGREEKETLKLAPLSEW